MAQVKEKTPVLTVDLTEDLPELWAGRTLIARGSIFRGGSAAEVRECAREIAARSRRDDQYLHARVALKGLRG